MINYEKKIMNYKKKSLKRKLNQEIEAINNLADDKGSKKPEVEIQNPIKVGIVKEDGKKSKKSSD